MTPEIRHLLGGYATGTLTDDERARLFAAALDDQALFDALAEEQPLKDLLDDPESRGYLLAELDQPVQTELPVVAVRMSKMARSAPAPTSVSMPPPPKPTARFWLPFAAVMVALVVTGWFWWKSAPEPTMQVAVNAPPAATLPTSIGPAPVAPKQSSGAGPRPAFVDHMRQGELARDNPATQKTPARTASSALDPKPLADSQAPKAAEARQELARADTVQPLKKELDAVAGKADDAIAATPAPAVTAGKLATSAPPAYRLLRLENAQYVPTSTATRFQAGDIIVILLPVPSAGQPTGPQLALANGASIALEREGDWYRSAKIELQSGSPEFLVTPDNSAAARSRFAAGEAAEAKSKASAPLLRIRLTVD